MNTSQEKDHIKFAAGAAEATLLAGSADGFSSVPEDVTPISIPEDVARFEKLGVLGTLLKDRTTDKNIVWATDAYEGLSNAFSKRNEIFPRYITGKYAHVIKRRALKNKDEKSALTKKHAEVFTPSWIVKLMVDAADTTWVQNLKHDKNNGEHHSAKQTNTKQQQNLTEPSSTANEPFDANKPFNINELINGSGALGKNAWQTYIASRRLEITCGEAPYLVNRYDAADGAVTPLPERTGILSRKLLLVNAHAKTCEDWMHWAEIALQSVYGYEFQGDNLLIARINALCTIEDYFSDWQDVYGEHHSQNENIAYDGYFSEAEYERFAKIISWNFWQMDGLSKCTPFGVLEEKDIQPTLFDFLDDASDDWSKKEPEETCPNCIIYDWEQDKTLEFLQIKKGASMKFDYIIGNPPYQDETIGDNKGYAPPIYNQFMDEAYKVSEVVELITPARFLMNAGSTPKVWNNKMLNDNHFKVLYYEADSSKVFPNTDIKGGIAITIRDENKDYGSIEIFTPFVELNSILARVVHAANFSTFSEIVFTRTAFRLTDKMHEDNPQAIGCLSKGHPYDMATNIFESLPFIFYDEKPLDNHEYIQIYGRENNKRTFKYLRKDYANEGKNLNSYKIFVPKANGSGALGETLTTPLIGLPLIGHTESFISIGSFKTEQEANACMKYIKTKFARALLGVLKVTQDNPPDKWEYVPLQDFTSSSDIDWTQSVAEIDVALYKKYNLSDEEIEFIETHVKAMD